MPEIPASAEGAEQEARERAQGVLELLTAVEAPAARRAEFLSEQLSFLQTRENYRCFCLLFEEGDEVPAAMLARVKAHRSSPDLLT